MNRNICLLKNYMAGLGKKKSVSDNMINLIQNGSVKRPVCLIKVTYMGLIIRNLDPIKGKQGVFFTGVSKYGKPRLGESTLT